MAIQLKLRKKELILNSRILLSSPHMGGTEEKYVAKAFKDN